jgi:hypothetical protein
MNAPVMQIQDSCAEKSIASCGANLEADADAVSVHSVPTALQLAL